MYLKKILMMLCGECKSTVGISCYEPTVNICDYAYEARTEVGLDERGQEYENRVFFIYERF